MTRILATGARGTLGGYLPDEDVLKTDIDELDVTDRDTVSAWLNTTEPEIVLHLGAETDVDSCELNPDRAFEVNALGTRNVALECARRDIKLLYVSTAGVFGGEKHTPYNEFDIAVPANEYGRAKLAGELYVRQFVPRSFVVRAGWMVGGGPDQEKKFIGKMLERASRTGSIRAVADRWGSPTYARDFAASMMKLIETDSYGIYHMVNEGACTRFEIAALVNELLGSPYKVTPVSSAEFPLSAPRARSEILDNLVLRLDGRSWMPEWRIAIRSYLETEWSDWSR